MSQSERLARLMSENPNYVSRSKVRDSSELTAIRQAQSSRVQDPQLVVSADGVSTFAVIQGKGTNKEYLNVLQRAQGCAVCADSVGADILPGIYPGAPNVSTLSSFMTYDRTKYPFSPLSVLSTAGYKEECKVQNPVEYFPPFVQRGDTNVYKGQGIYNVGDYSTSIAYQHLPYDS
jgi:hypothetical protein